MKTLYWHDYETWGEVPAKDRASQFAGIRTDEDLNVIGSPLMLYCQPTRDVLPKPDACLVTGLTPQKALAEGVSEPEFIARVHAELSAPGTCGVGYNTLRFDDEVSRYTLYRNFYDPYEREWRNGNSRWDIIDMVRLTRAIRPEGIEWPVHEDGRPSFKLEHLTQANGLSHQDAHDALSDVHATIAVARLIKQKQPGLYDYIYQLRDKHRVNALIDLHNRKPLLHISSMFPAENGCAAVVIPLAMHPTNKNGVVVFDLSASPEELLTLTAEQIAERLFTRKEDLPEGVDRIPLKVVHVNKCPVLATVKLLDQKAAARWNIDLAQCESHWQQLRGADIARKLQSVYTGQIFKESQDPEQQLYGGFLKDEDKRLCQKVRGATPDALAAIEREFSDTRLQTMMFRYRARHFAHTLTPQEQQEWENWRVKRLTDPEAEAGITVDQLYKRVAELRHERDLTQNENAILEDLLLYGQGLLAG
ncbi:MAG: exodeoxyribonuclease I [Candidatus Pelagadaptatus aseana]|uniref:exodeoxyribonuclease I n=1 Tax=Candidatus Pelagadaptatus aseana TaxID=3120508 RepID=UPI0039B26761